MDTLLKNNKCLNSVLKLWLPLMWLPQPRDFKWFQKQFCTFLLGEYNKHETLYSRG